MANSKIIYYGETLIDLTGDTIRKDKLLKGFSAHGADGEPMIGTCLFDMDTSEMNAAAAEILVGKKAGVKGAAVTGTMPNHGSVSGTINTKDGTYTPAQGYHDGGGKVQIAATEQAKLVPENIREGISVLGVTGTMSGTEDAKPQAKEVTPGTTEQVVLPDTGYNYLSQVTVAPIPYTESENSAGGITVTIG